MNNDSLFQSTKEIGQLGDLENEQSLEMASFEDGFVSMNDIKQTKRDKMGGYGTMEGEKVFEELDVRPHPVGSINSSKQRDISKKILSEKHLLKKNSNSKRGSNGEMTSHKEVGRRDSKLTDGSQRLVTELYSDGFSEENMKVRVLEASKESAVSNSFERQKEQVKMLADNIR